MRKREFVHALVEDHDILMEDANKIYDAVCKTMRNQLLTGNEVRIEGVGAFHMKFRQAGTVNNNLLGKRHKIGPRVRLKFKTFPSMQRDLNQILAREMAEEG